MGFCPDQIAIRFFVSDANELFEFLLGLLVACCIGSLRRSLGSPGGVSETKLNPARLERTQLAPIDFGVEFVDARIRSLNVLGFGVVLQLGVVRFLRYGIEQQEGKGEDGKDDCFHGGNGTVKSGETCVVTLKAFA